MSFTFNGISKDFVHVTIETERPIWAPVEREIVEIPGRQGAYLRRTKTKPRILAVNIVIKGVSDLQKAKEEIADWLITDEPEALIFPDEPDRTYYGMIDGEGQLAELFKFGKATVNFICPDPYKYGLEHSFEIGNPPDPIGHVQSAGSAPTYPIVECTFAEPADQYEIQLLNDDESVKAFVLLNFDFIAGDQLILDFANRSATLNGEDKKTAYHHTSDFFKIPPKRDTLIRVTQPSTIRFTDKYK
ncbi:phage tail family protein [Bacillus sp. CLL-7-23]|uniref:Phage tail family protein n=1 Tax=Bacillus changyiensis TaxID=3004103 RepID=A0ABT4X9Z2_9BACI|nr:distal tail protein Dit [Bacillus changyiensis]MDA1477263.1 phage tail family protein [Bacillus changyiensis]MDA7028529.1 phage tail family protein [Bacillus changyiensis]